MRKTDKTPEQIAAEAIDLISSHDDAVTRCVHANNAPGLRGIVGATQQLRRSIIQLFVAMTGRKPTEGEINTMMRG